MYNTIYLDSKYWRYQHFWDGELKVGIAPRIKVIKTNIYGIRSSGNLAECALRRTAELTKSEYPLAHDVIVNDVYVDDCLSGSNTENERSKTVEFPLAIAKGGFKLKGFTFSGMHPPENVANEDRISINVGGVIWFPLTDVYCLKNPKRNFRKRKKVIRDKLVRRDCVGVVFNIFDPGGFRFGKVVRIVAWAPEFIKNCYC